MRRSWTRTPRAPSGIHQSVLAALIILTTCPVTFGASSQGDAERIYRAGILPSGQPLHGLRVGGVAIEGQAAACINCHRRSGIGVNEGKTVIPPITGKYLLRAGERPLPESEMQSAGVSIGRHTGYDDETLVRAIREGINADGKPLSYLMPRFALKDADAALLVDYLKSLSSGPGRGVTHDEANFATIITPDADPAERSGTLDVLQHFFANKNIHERGHDPQLISARRIHYRVTYKWQLHIWELSGPAETWEGQLEAHLRAEPVLAVISGVGGRNWAPVHHFCEREALPCLFPNVELPVVAEGDFYPLYLSRGVLLEADLIRTALRSSARASRNRIVQVYRPGEIGEAAARALGAKSTGQSTDWVDRPLPPGGGSGDLREALAGVRPDDTVVLWLRADDLRNLPADPPAAAGVFASGLLGGLENAPLPPKWRSATRITYPVDLPQRRAMRLIQPLTWFRTQGIPVVAERVQVDTYVACQVLSEAVGHAFADMVPDYLIEQIENMVSVKLLDGYYPRLGLAPGQRFASKGGYLVQLSPQPGAPVIADSAWLVP